MLCFTGGFRSLLSTFARARGVSLRLASFFSQAWFVDVSQAWTHLWREGPSPKLRGRASLFRQVGFMVAMQLSVNAQTVRNMHATPWVVRK
jgi:hypothetical protein